MDIKESIEVESSNRVDTEIKFLRKIREKKKWLFILAVLNDLDYKELGLSLHNGGRKGYPWLPRDSLAHLHTSMLHEECKQAAGASKA